MVTSVCQKTHMSSKDLGLVEASDELVTILLKVTQKQHFKSLHGSGKFFCSDTDLKLKWLSYPLTSLSCLPSFTLCHNF